MQFILIKLSPPWTPFTYPHSLPSQLHVLILTKTNKRTNKSKHKTAIKNPRAQRTHTHTITKVKIKEKKATVSILCWLTTPELETCPGVPPFQTTYFSIPASYHLKIAFCLGVEFCVHLFFSMLVVLLLLLCVVFGLNLCRYF